MDKVAIYPGKKMVRSAGTTNRSDCQIALPFFFRAKRRRQAVQVGLKFGWRRLCVYASISNMLGKRLSGPLFSWGHEASKALLKYPGEWRN
jgi:hypothetical protein